MLAFTFKLATRASFDLTNHKRVKLSFIHMKGSKENQFHMKNKLL